MKCVVFHFLFRSFFIMGFCLPRTRQKFESKNSYSSHSTRIGNVTKSILHQCLENARMGKKMHLVLLLDRFYIKIDFFFFAVLHRLSLTQFVVVCMRKMVRRNIPYFRGADFIQFHFFFLPLTTFIVLTWIGTLIWVGKKEEKEKRKKIVASVFMCENRIEWNEYSTVSVLFFFFFFYKNHEYATATNKQTMN